jgi:hypothetical protein
MQSLAQGLARQVERLLAADEAQSEEHREP